MCEIKDCFLIEAGYWIDKEKQIFKRKEILPASLVNAIRLKRNNKGVFATAYTYDIEDQNNANLYGDFYLDFDSKDFEEVREDVIMAMSYIKVVFKIDELDKCQIFYSGNKGMHIIVPAKVLGIKPDKKLNEIFKVVAKAISDYTKNKTLDLRIYDNKRMFRMPNSIHESTGRHKVFLTYEEVKSLSIDDINNIASEPREIPEKCTTLSLEANKMFKMFKERAEKAILEFSNIKSNGTLKYTPPCIIEILESGAIDGKRNNTIAILSSFYKASGKDLKETLELLNSWNEEKNSKPTPKGELIKTATSIFQREHSFGCSAIKSLELCKDEECKFKKERDI